MNRINLLIRALNWIGMVIFPKKWKGYRTLVTAALVFVIGFIQLILDSTIPEVACSNFMVMCDWESSQFYAWLLMVIGLLNAILRAITDTPIGES